MPAPLLRICQRAWGTFGDNEMPLTGSAFMSDVTMPQLGETVTEGTITKWFKQVGDTVVRGEPLFEVSTDKVDTEIPAPADGVLTAILVDHGDTVDVGVTLAVIEDHGAPSAISSVSSRAAAIPTEAAPPSPSPVAPPYPQAPSGDTPPLSPVVRRLLREHDIDPTTVTGTGPGGRITRQDVDMVISAGTPAPASSPTRPIPIPLTGDEFIPFTKVRRLTAGHMVRSKATSAHTLMVKEVDYERVEQIRRTHGAAVRNDEGFSLTYLSFNACAAVQALGTFPHLNASVGDDALIVHHDLNLGIAVDLDGDGLIVPVLHRADALNLRGMARGIRDVASRARSKRLSLDGVSNGTFSITNPGPFGTLMTGAIINQPQVAILSTDGVVRKPVVVALPEGGESIAIHSVGMLALTFDHRALDGAYAARFLARMAEIINTRDWASEL